MNRSRSARTSLWNSVDRESWSTGQFPRSISTAVTEIMYCFPHSHSSSRSLVLPSTQSEQLSHRTFTLVSFTLSLRLIRSHRGILNGFA